MPESIAGLLSQDYRQVTIADIPADAEINAVSEVFLLFGEDSVRIYLSIEGYVHRYVVFSSYQYSAKGIISFAILLQNGMFSFYQVKRFLLQCYIAFIHRLVGQLLPRFFAFYSVECVYLLCDLFRGAGREALACLLYMQDSNVSYILYQNRHELLTFELFDRYVKFHVFEQKDSCILLVKHICSRSTEFMQSDGVLLILMLNQCELCNCDNRVSPIIEQYILQLNPAKYYKLLIYFVSINVSHLSYQFTDAVFYYIFKAQDPYSLFNKFVALDFPEAQKQKYINIFIQKAKGYSTDNEQRSLLFKTLFQFADIKLLETPFTSSELRKYLQFKKSVLCDISFTKIQIEELSDINDLYFIICLTRLNNNQLLSNLTTILRSMREEFTFFIHDPAVFLYLRYNFDNFAPDQLISNFPRVDKYCLHIVLALSYTDFSVSGFQATICYAASYLMSALTTGYFNTQVFDVAESQLYLNQILFPVALLVEDHRFVRQMARAFKFTEQTLSLLASFEKQLVIVLIQMEKLLNFVCSYRFYQENFKFAFSYYLVQHRLNENNIAIIYACYRSCYKVALFYYLMLETLDISVRKRYFNQMFQHSVLMAVITGDCNCLMLILEKDTANYALIASNVLDKEIYLSPAVESIFRVMRLRTFTLQHCQEITECIKQCSRFLSDGDLNVALYIVYQMLSFVKEKQVFRIQQILFHSVNYYIDNFVNRSHIIKILVLCRTVYTRFQHINCITTGVYELIQIIICAARVRNCFISEQDLQIKQLSSAMIYSEFVQYLVDYLLESTQYPTYNLASLSIISGYVFRMEPSERNRVSSQYAQAYLRKYINAQIAYSKRSKPDRGQFNYYYHIFETILQKNENSTFCYPIRRVFELIYPHFAVDLQLSQIALIFLLSKLYIDYYYRKSVSDLIFDEIYSIVADKSDQGTQKAQNLCSIISSAGIDIFDAIMASSKIYASQNVRFTTNIDDYRLTDYSVLILLIEFLRTAGHISLSYFYVAYGLQHQNIQNYIAMSSGMGQYQLLTHLLQYSPRGADTHKYIIRINHNCELNNYFDEIRSRIGEYYFGSGYMAGIAVDGQEFYFLVYKIKFNSVPLRYLETLLSHDFITSNLLSQSMYQSYMTTPESQYYTLMCAYLDTNSEFSESIDEKRLTNVFKNLYDIVYIPSTHKLVLDKIIQIYFKIKANLADAYLNVMLILLTHNIILRIFLLSPNLAEMYYKIFFVIWLQGCYIFKTGDCKHMVHKFLHIYLTHQRIPEAQSGSYNPLLQVIEKNFDIIESVILKIHPFYFLNYIVYICDGYQYLITANNEKQIVFLLKIILISLPHYAHFDLLFRKMGIYYENDYFCCDLRPVLQNYMVVLFAYIERSAEYGAIFRKYKAYSTDYTKTILAMKALTYTNRMEQIRTVFYYPSFAFLKASLECVTVSQYEKIMSRFQVFSFKFEKSFNSKAKPQLYSLYTALGERKLIIKGEDQTLIDNCIMDYLDNLNEMLSFTTYRFRTYYIGYIYKEKASKGYNIIEVLDNVIPLNDFIEYFPKYAFYKDMSQNYQQKVHYYAEIQEQYLLKFTICGKNAAIQSLDQHFKIVDSIACWHVIHYILAIADRHCDNILIDTKDQTVHNIDFEACFFYGKDLPFPDVIDLRFSPIILYLLGPATVQSRYQQIVQNMLGIVNYAQYLFLNCFMSVGGILQKAHIVVRLYERLSCGFCRFWYVLQKSMDVVNYSLMFEGWKPFDQTIK